MISVSLTLFIWLINWKKIGMNLVQQTNGKPSGNGTEFAHNCCIIQQQQEDQQQLLHHSATTTAPSTIATSSSNKSTINNKAQGQRRFGRHGRSGLRRTGCGNRTRLHAFRQRLRHGRRNERRRMVRDGSGAPDVALVSAWCVFFPDQHEFYVLYVGIIGVLFANTKPWLTCQCVRCCRRASNGTPCSASPRLCMAASSTDSACVTGRLRSRGCRSSRT